MNHFVLFSSFIAVVETGSFTKAATHLGKTKPVVSRQVAQLEEILGVRLLNRTTRSISITDHGRAIYEKSRYLLDEMDNLARPVDKFDTSLSGRIRITAPQSVGELNVIEVIADFMKEHPNLKVELLLSDRYVDIVEEGIDIALRLGSLDDSNLIAREIGKFTVCLVASPDFLKRYSIKALSDLESVPCIYDTNHRMGSKWHFSKGEKLHSVRVNSVLCVNSANAAAFAAEKGVGVALSPTFSAKSGLEKGSLVKVLPEYKVNAGGMHVVYPHRKYLTNTVRVFVDYLSKHLVVL